MFPKIPADHRYKFSLQHAACWPRSSNRWSNQLYLISHLWFRALSIYYINKPTWCNLMQSYLFFTAVHCTCFGCFLHPSSGVQLNCSYSHRYISSFCVVWLKSIDSRPWTHFNWFKPHHTDTRNEPMTVTTV
jgi:hypothetical protein